MAYATPWQVNEVQLGRSENSGYRIRELAAQRFDLRSDWGYLCAAGLSLLTFLLLFQPWVSATGPNGTVSANAFGRIDGFTSSTWQSGGSNVVSISGAWAVLTTMAVAGTVFSVVLYFRVRSQALSRLVMGTSAAAALFVLITLLYLNSKAPELRGLTESASHAGLFSWLFGNGMSSNLGPGEHRIASAGLDLGATLSAITACGAALAAAAMGLRKQPSTALRMIATARPVRAKIAA
ncbi:hypothetical protein [Nocardia nepalensis]|uniref:hypothetical protein n=1 Tax=Nocardia nepalensis TaxID=3375448 RepID=UPI003B6808A6